MGLAADLFAQNLALADACLTHPFVRGIADGSLDPSKFTNYVAQDAFYLRAFARAYALGAARCDQALDFAAFIDLAKGVDEELKLHAEYADELGIDLGRVRPLESTSAYTDFLLATAWHSGIAETVAAMAPCMRLYAHLGVELAKDGIPAHRYGTWIETYSSREFTGLAALLDGLLDRLGEKTRPVRAAYAKAMRLELEFFDAAWR